jgi:hypothetical protein
MSPAMVSSTGRICSKVTRRPASATSWSTRGRSFGTSAAGAFCKGKGKTPRHDRTHQGVGSHELCFSISYILRSPEGRCVSACVC